MTTAMETAEQIAILEEVLDLFDQAAEQLRLLRNPRDRGVLPRGPRGLAARLARALRPGRAGGPAAGAAGRRGRDRLEALTAQPSDKAGGLAEAVPRTRGSLAVKPNSEAMMVVGDQLPIDDVSETSFETLQRLRGALALAPLAANVGVALGASFIRACVTAAMCRARFNCLSPLLLGNGGAGGPRLLEASTGAVPVYAA